MKVDNRPLVIEPTWCRRPNDQRKKALLLKIVSAKQIINQIRLDYK